MNTLKTIDEAIEALQRIHDLCACMGEYYVKDPDGFYFEIDMGAEYTDSSTYGATANAIINLKALRDKLVSEELVEDVKSALAQVFVTETRDCLAPFTATEAIVRINKHGLAKAAIKAMGV